MPTPARPILLFDGECGFCTLTAAWAAQRLVRPVALLPWQKADLAHLGLSLADARRAAWWIDESGRPHGGHRAVGQALLACGAFWSRLGRLVLLPAPVAWLMALGYHVVTRLRRFLPGTTPACRGSLPWDAARDRPCR